MIFSIGNLDIFGGKPGNWEIPGGCREWLNNFIKVLK